MAMKPKIYHILSNAIETGALIGYHRAFKHQENPSERSIAESVHDAIMNEIAEYFSFDDDY